MRYLETLTAGYDGMRSLAEPKNDVGKDVIGYDEYINERCANFASELAGM